jgi:hypothetical protein
MSAFAISSSKVVVMIHIGGEFEGFGEELAMYVVFTKNLP